MQSIKAGEAFRFTPSAFSEEKSAKVGKLEIPRELAGSIVYIHPERRFFMVEAEVNGYKLRESFKIF